MQAGHLTERITIERKESGFDPIGQPIEEWVTYLEAWANIRHLSGVETIRADAEVSVVRASIRIRTRPGRWPHAGMRIVHGDTIYNVRAVLPGRLRFNKHIDMIAETIGSPS